MRQPRLLPERKGLTLYAWCIMTNHLHLICSAPPLPGVVRDFKKYTSREIIKAVQHNPLESRKGWLLWLFKSAGENSNKNEVFEFWQTGYHPILLDTNFLIDQRLNYLHQNPVKAGFVEEPEDWFYSSAKDYAGRAGRLNLTFIS
jgi:REP element-mobilizing transposase RayT